MFECGCWNGNQAGLSTSLICLKLDSYLRKILKYAVSGENLRCNVFPPFFSLISISKGFKANLICLVY